MAHEISVRANGFAEMAYAGNDVPWHGLGQSLDENASIETWQKQAGMDWEIKESPVMYQAGDVEIPMTFDGKKLLYRGDSSTPLSIVSDSYKVVQPKEVLEFFRSLVEDQGFKLSTAGVLFNGQKFWALADTGNSVKINGVDKIGGFLLLSTSCDGTLATSARFTSVRVVCNNTLTIALNNNSSKVSTSHRSDFKATETKKALGLYEDSWDRFQRTMVEMSQIKLTSKDAYAELLRTFCDDPTDPTNAELKVVNTVENLYNGAGMGADVAGKTVYGLLNAITEYYDHNLGRNANNIVQSNFWGYSAKNKEEVFARLTGKYVETV